MVAIVVSILALGVSVASPAFEYWWNRKINVKNLQSQYFMTIYGKYLMEDLPNAREYIHFNNNELSGTEKLIDVLRNIRKSSLFFKSSDNNFYKKLLTTIQGFEDYLVLANPRMTNDQFIEFHNNCNIHIDNIYCCINDAYIGKSNRGLNYRKKLII